MSVDEYPEEWVEQAKEEAEDEGIAPEQMEAYLLNKLDRYNERHWERWQERLRN